MGSLKDNWNNKKLNKRSLIQTIWQPGLTCWERAEAVTKRSGWGCAWNDWRGKGPSALSSVHLSQPQEPHFGRSSLSPLSSTQCLDFLSSHPSSKNCHVMVVGYLGFLKREFLEKLLSGDTNVLKIRREDPILEKIKKDGCYGLGMCELNEWMGHIHT